MKLYPLWNMIVRYTCAGLNRTVWKQIPVNCSFSYLHNVLLKILDPVLVSPLLRVQTCVKALGVNIDNRLTLHYNELDGLSNHQPHDCLLNRLFRRISKKASKLRFTGLSGANSPITGEFPTQRVSNATNVSIWWRHHVLTISAMLL